MRPGKDQKEMAQWRAQLLSKLVWLITNIREWNDSVKTIKRKP